VFGPIKGYLRDHIPHILCFMRFRCAHRDRVCVRMFIEMSVRTCMSICIYIVFRDQRALDKTDLPAKPEFHVTGFIHNLSTACKKRCKERVEVLFKIRNCPLRLDWGNQKRRREKFIILLINSLCSFGLPNKIMTRSNPPNNSHSYNKDPIKVWFVCFSSYKLN
jgi:hypothetical protein